MVVTKLRGQTAAKESGSCVCVCARSVALLLSCDSLMNLYSHCVSLWHTEQLSFPGFFSSQVATKPYQMDSSINATSGGQMRSFRLVLNWIWTTFSLLLTLSHCILLSIYQLWLANCLHSLSTTFGHYFNH